MDSSTHVIPRSKWVALAAIMSALTVVSGYAVVMVPNVELLSSILFITGYLFGPLMSIWSSLILAAVFGTLNPWGGFFPQIWVSQLLGWLFISLAGAAAGNQGLDSKKVFSSLELGVIGIIVTVFYDLITNIGYSLAFSVPYSLALAAGAPFMLIHVVSNCILFALIVPPVEQVMRNTLATLIWNPENDNLLPSEG
jgi:uncharacterized membrane protein